MIYDKSYSSNAIIVDWLGYTTDAVWFSYVVLPVPNQPDYAGDSLRMIEGMSLPDQWYQNCDLPAYNPNARRTIG